jgi:basic membrane protein A
VDHASPAASTRNRGTTSGAEASREPLRVGLVTDSSGLSAGSINQLASVGLRRAEAQLGVSGRVLVSRSSASFARNLSLLAGRHYDLVIGVGPGMAPALNAVAQRFPETRFTGIGITVDALPSRPRNAAGITFREEQAGYLAGYLAGLVEQSESGSKHTVGVVGARRVPSVERYVAGYVAGARAAAPRITILEDFSRTFDDPAKCKELALQHMAEGSDLEFQVAGRCGLGVLDAAKERNVWGIGVDMDQSYLGAHVLTSALRRVDVAVFSTIRSMQDGSLQFGTDTVFDATNGGVGLGRISARVPQDVVAQVRAEEQRLASGHLPSIPTPAG